MCAEKILNAMKVCMEHVSDDKLLPVLKTLISAWEGNDVQYQQQIEELKQLFPQPKEKEDE